MRLTLFLLHRLEARVPTIGGRKPGANKKKGGVRYSTHFSVFVVGKAECLRSLNRYSDVRWFETTFSPVT